MEHLMPALIARAFYLEGRSKKQIGDDLGISRFKVARILDQAVADGIVRIEIASPPDVDLRLSAALATRFGLRQALVVRPAADQDDMRRQLGRACMAVLTGRITQDDVLGISWGRTLHALTGVVTPLPEAELVQIVGSVPTADLTVNPQALIQRFADATRGPVHALHVPMVLDSPQLADSLRHTGHLAATMARFGHLTCALVGIGSWTPGGSSLRDALPAGLREDLDAAGAVADVCSTVVGADGEIIGGDIVPAHCIAITTQQLRDVPDVIALAGGADKAPAIGAVLTTGIVNRLITDAAAATALLASPP